MRSLLIIFIALITLNVNAQSTDGKKLDKCVNATIKGLKKLDTADVQTFRALMLSDAEIDAFIDAMEVEEEFKEEIRANVSDGMFDNAMTASFQDFVRITRNMKIDWKKVVYEDFLYEMRKRDGLKQLRGELFISEGEKQLQIQLTAALLNGKYVIIELEDLRGVRDRRNAEAEAEEMIREMEEAMEEAEYATEEAYEEDQELIDRMERLEENEEEEPRVMSPVPPPVVIEEPVEPGTVREEVIEFPDVEAEFPGGTGALQQFIMETVKYPVEALEKGIQGRVYLSFVVEKDGTLTQIKVERGVSKELDGEAKRVVRAMPKWKPGEAAGRTVRTRCRLPIVFVLEDDNEDEK